jgi:transcriptional regulator with XRE-family HTH domain
LTPIRIRIEWLETTYLSPTMTFRTAQEACQLLVAHKRSQAAIAARAGVTQPTISRILAGHHDPAGSILIKLNEFADEVLEEAQNRGGEKTGTESQPQ